MEENLDSGENFAQMFADNEASTPKLHTGQKIGGKIIAITGDDAFVDIGVKEDGVIDIKELSSDSVPQIGDYVEGFITSISSQGIKLSRYMGGNSIEALEEAREAQIPVEGKVKSAIKGGYQVELLGKTAFCPGSQMAQREPAEIIGQTLPFIITRIENNGRNIVVSNRALVEREQKENLDNLLASINAGDILEGKMTRSTPFGIFVELAPGVEGLIHVSEIAWSHVTDPAEEFVQDQPVKVKFLGKSEDQKGRIRLSLSRKQAMDDPWMHVSENFAIDDVVDGVVRRLAPFGAFIEIGEGIEGLAHVSELSWEKRINNPADLLNVGDKVRVKIKDINADSKKISLSVRDAAGDPWAGVEEKYVVGQKYQGKVESKSQHGVFVSLEPGIIGLLPVSAIRDGAKNTVSQLSPGDPIDIVIQKVDCPAKRISLIIENPENAPEDQSWKKHTKSESTGEGQGMTMMALALEKAKNKKLKGAKS